jgi:hypothetical protein
MWKKWSEEKPSEPGYYWSWDRLGGRSTGAVHVTFHDGKIQVVDMESWQTVVPEALVNEEWVGPIKVGRKDG